MLQRYQLKAKTITMELLAPNNHVLPSTDVEIKKIMKVQHNKLKRKCSQMQLSEHISKL